MSIIELNQLGGEILPLTTYLPNLQRWSSVEQKGIFYLMASFCLKYLGKGSKEKTQRMTSKIAI